MSGQIDLVSSAHATMALGHLSSTLWAQRRDPDDMLVCPQPPEWLELWREAVEGTRELAVRDFAERARTALDLHRSIDDVRGGHERQPTESERLLVEVLAMAHYEAWGRVSGHAMAPWAARDPQRLAFDRAAMAELLRIGAVSPGPALESVAPLDEHNPDRLRELGAEDIARGAIEALVEALDRRGLKVAEAESMREAVAEALGEVMDGVRATAQINGGQPEEAR